ncbi:MAG TPA: methylmalonyl Co-A mutase-associated GTPase MeaB [Firmicutes bacterium]|jgi:LAO/AO transport system kinase|nr:methylmalonyl Co-A mutase-associated GTPase MeaB [Bacillota bacterium]
MVLYLHNQVIQGLRDRKRAALARAVTLVEDGSEHAQHILEEAYRLKGRSKIIGITGSPGVGKSTLVDSLIEAIRERGDSVGVIAVDPSSPFTGGAILGDRVRVRSRTTDDGVFFRSLASRGYLGGLSRNTGDVITLFDAFGFDYVLVETVGTGQSEVDIMRYAHSVLVVMAPGLGDDIQAIKAGILEIGDVFCVNKADRPDADRDVAVLEAMLGLNKDWQWRPPVVKTVASQGKGVPELLDKIDEHLGFLKQGNLLEERVSRSYLAALEANLRRQTVEHVLSKSRSDGSLDCALKQLSEGKTYPAALARQLVEKYLCSGV